MKALSRSPKGFSLRWFASPFSGKFCTTTVFAAGNLAAIDGVAATIALSARPEIPSRTRTIPDSGLFSQPGIQVLFMICSGTSSWTS